MPVKRRASKHREQLHDAVQRAINGLPVENTRANRTALVNEIWLRRYQSDLTEDERHRALTVLSKLRQDAEAGQCP
jgi:hypothetical protein